MGDLISHNELQILSGKFITNEETIFDLDRTDHVIIKHLLLLRLLLLWGWMMMLCLMDCPDGMGLARMMFGCVVSRVLLVLVAVFLSVVVILLLHHHLYYIFLILKPQ